MSEPTSHHFISQFILDNFRDDNLDIHSFNAVFKKPNKPTKSTKYIYSEDDLHTLIYKDEKIYDIEGFYSKIEGEFSIILRSINDAIKIDADLSEISNSIDMMKIIGYFASLSFWRLPSTSNLARSARKDLRKIFDRASDENKGLLDKDRKFIRDLERKGGKISEKICQFVAIPVLKANLSNRNLQFFQTDFDLIVSDNPVVCEIDGNFDFFGDFYMPISPRLCLTNRSEKIKEFNAQVFWNARKIVIGRSKESLLKCVSERLQ